MTPQIIEQRLDREAQKRATNQALMDRRLAAFNGRSGPRVGDFIRLPDLHPKLGKWTRLTHDHGGHIQTGGSDGGSYYIGGTGYLSYSGGLDPGVPTAALLPTTETRTGHVWFFDGDLSGAGRGVTFDIPCRVFTLKEDTDLSGIYELNCPYTLIVLDEAGNKRTCNYWYLIDHHAMSHTAFRTRPELDAWLTANGLQTNAAIEHGVHSYQRLSYRPE